jgi:ABC-type glutathione transport system ATPase component
VAKHIFHKCISGWLAVEQRAAVVLVTHQRQFMPNVDRIVLMDGGDVVNRKRRQEALEANFKKIRTAVKEQVRKVRNKKIGMGDVVLMKIEVEKENKVKAEAREAVIKKKYFFVLLCFSCHVLSAFSSLFQCASFLFLKLNNE